MRQIEANSHYPIDLRHLPEKWETAFVGDVIADIQPGFACGAHNQEGVGVPHLRPMNVDREGRLDLSLVKFVPPNNSLRVKKGDILFNSTNSPELIGKTTTVERKGEWAFSNHMTRLRPPREISPRFVAHQLHYRWGNWVFSSSMHSSRQPSEYRIENLGGNCAFSDSTHSRTTSHRR
jgi:type I restriction enzyme S subunit